MNNNQPKHNPSVTNKVNLIKLSADVHKRDYKVCRQIGDQNIQPAQVFEPEAAFQWAVKQLAVAERVDRFLAGNDEALVPVRIPSEVEEDQRAVSRQRDQLLKARKQFEAQGRSLLFFKGLNCPRHWWGGSEADWQQTLQQQGWPGQIVELLEVYRRMALAADREVAALTLALEKAAAQHLPPSLPALPHGFGALSMEILRREVCDWNRFKNRGQVGSFFGICCAESTSGERQIQGSITKTGNPTAGTRSLNWPGGPCNFSPITGWSKNSNHGWTKPGPGPWRARNLLWPWRASSGWTCGGFTPAKPPWPGWACGPKPEQITS